MPAWNEPAPETFAHTWNASDEPITPPAASASPASLVPHPGLISTATPAPCRRAGGAARRTSHPPTHEREDEDGEDADDRPRAASAAGPVGADPSPWPPRRRTTSGPSTPWDRFGGRFGNRTRRIGRRIGGFGQPARRIGRRIGGVGEPGRRIGRRIGPKASGADRLAERPSHDSSWPPSSVGVTRAARTPSARATTAGSPPRPTASTSSRCARRRRLRRGVASRRLRWAIIVVNRSS